MMARIRKSMEEKDQGFTLIELLVVMIIIGILAAIAVPVFLSQRGKARLTSAKSDASVISKEMAAYYVDGTDGLTVAASGTAWTIKTTGTGTPTVSQGTLSKGNTVAYATGTTAGKYCVVVGTSDSADGSVTVSGTGLTVNPNVPNTCTAA